jgi:hypothetical protein
MADLVLAKVQFSINNSHLKEWFNQTTTTNGKSNK